MESRICALKYIALHGSASIGEIAEQCAVSYPTANKLIDDLVKDGTLRNLGRHHKEGGRMPTKFGFNPSSGYYAGVMATDDVFEFGIIDNAGTLIYKNILSLHLLHEEGSPEELCDHILAEIAASKVDLAKIVACTVTLPGRVNVRTGESLNYFVTPGKKLSESIASLTGIKKIYLENDSRVMCYGEYVDGHWADYENVLYINFRWGLGMGMILGGDLFYGATGLSGELGHVNMFQNEIFCRCGKKGCIETEASGLAMLRLLKTKNQAGARSLLSHMIERGERPKLKDFVEAIKSEDMLIIEIMEEVGTQLGKGIAAMINVFNPNLVILGGMLVDVKDYVQLPVMSSVRKYSLNVASRDTKIVVGNVRDPEITGGCYIARNKTIGIL